MAMPLSFPPPLLILDESNTFRLLMASTLFFLRTRGLLLSSFLGEGEVTPRVGVVLDERGLCRDCGLCPVGLVGGEMLQWPERLEESDSSVDLIRLMPPRGEEGTSRLSLKSFLEVRAEVEALFSRAGTPGLLLLGDRGGGRTLPVL